MKRLLAQIGITYFSVLAVAFYLSETAVIVLSSCFTIASVVLLIVRKTRKTIYVPAMAIAALIACLVNIGYTCIAVNPITERYANSTHTVEARLTEEPYKSYSTYYYRLETTKVDGEDIRFKLLLKLSRPAEADVDDTFRFNAEPEPSENDYYRSKGFFFTVDGYDSPYTVEEAENHSLYYHVVELRRKLRRPLDRLLTLDCASLCRAVLIGDKYALDSDIRDSFRYAGASYFIVVSGMHFAVLCLLVLKLLRRILPRYVAFGLSVLFLLLYMAVTGFQPSVLRSGIMMFIYMLGVTIRRQVYALNHLGIAGIVMPFIVSPYGAGDIGLILSFYATMGILLWASPIAQRISFKDEYGRIYRFHLRAAVRGAFNNDKRLMTDSERSVKERLTVFLKCLWNTVASLLSVSLSANLLVFPLSVLFFKAFSLVTFLSSLLLYALIYLILVLSLAVCTLFYLGPLRYIAVLLSWGLYGVCKAALWIVDFLSNLPFAYIHIRSAYFYIWLGVTVLLGVIVLLSRNRARRIRFAGFLSAFVLLACILTGSIVRLNTLSLEVYQCGDGLCVAVNSGGDLYLLNLNAKTKDRYAALNKLSDRYGKAQAVLCANEKEMLSYQRYSDREFAISSILLYDRIGIAEGDGVIPFSDDSTFLLDDGVTLYVSVDNGKVIPYLDINGKTALVIPAKCTADNIPKAWRSPDIAVVTASYQDDGALDCTDLIVSGAEESSRAAENHLPRYESVYYTCDGDITYNLR